MNDPRITAYALGELDPADRETFERELVTSTELQRELKETIALIEALPTAITMNEYLTDTSRETLRSRAAQNLRHPHPVPAHRRRAIAAGVGALAAGLVATAIVVSSNSGSKSTAPKIALRSTDSSPLAVASTVRGEISTPAAAATAPLDQPMKLGIAEKSEAISGPLAATEVAGKDLVAKQMERDQTGARLDDISAPAGGALAAKKPKPQSVASRDGYADKTVSSSMAMAEAPVSPAVPVPASAISGGVVINSESRDTFSPNTRFNKRAKTAFDTEGYDAVTGNAFLEARGNPLSTFSIDVDTASYANVRRFLASDQLPPAGAVRIEELVNYFPYRYEPPKSDAPFSVTTDVTRTPWNEKHLLARIALKGRDVATDNLPASNLVFLIDVSGSMDEPNKLPLLKRSLAALVGKLSPRDHVAIVVYAGSSGTALPSTAGEDKARILEAIDRLEAGGSTNGAEGIQLAYDIARREFLKEGNNRVILCTDGDFNVGVTSRSELVRLIERERKSGVFLSVLGFGTGNVKDSSMEQLADKGNGNYAYIDTASEGRKVLVEQMGATLFTIAKDVKIQVEFNPATVAGYRLIGYENRLLAKEDFNDDTKDAGEIGAGHTVTALYEIVPQGQPLPGTPSVDPLKYQQTDQAAEDRKSAASASATKDLFTVKLRYKAPDEDTSKLIEKAVGPEVSEFSEAPEDFRFASAVAAFGMKLRADRNDPSLDWNAIQAIARKSLGEDPGAYRAEFLTLVQKAKQISQDREQDERR